jgi:hypothetical protein
LPKEPVPPVIRRVLFENILPHNYINSKSKIISRLLLLVRGKDTDSLDVDIKETAQDGVS